MTSNEEKRTRAEPMKTCTVTQKEPAAEKGGSLLILKPPVINRDNELQEKEVSERVR